MPNRISPRFQGLVINVTPEHPSVNFTLLPKDGVDFRPLDPSARWDRVPNADTVVVNGKLLGGHKAVGALSAMLADKKVPADRAVRRMLDTVTTDLKRPLLTLACKNPDDSFGVAGELVMAIACHKLSVEKHQQFNLYGRTIHETMRNGRVTTLFDKDAKTHYNPPKSWGERWAYWRATRKMPRTVDHIQVHLRRDNFHPPVFVQPDETQKPFHALNLSPPPPRRRRTWAFLDMP